MPFYLSTYGYVRNECLSSRADHATRQSSITFQSQTCQILAGISVLDNQNW